MQITAIAAVGLSPPAIMQSLTRRGIAANSSPGERSPGPIKIATDIPRDSGEIHTTRVAGKHYPGDVAYGSGGYTISVSSLPGSRGRGLSLLAAKSALSSRIDILA